MKREQPKNGRKLLYIIMALLGLMAGCVAAPALTPEQVTQINVECNDNATCIIEKTDAAMETLLVQLEYERQDRRNIEVDKLCALMLTCRATENLIISRGWGRTGQNAHLDRFGECVITKRNRLRDYSCMTPADFRDAMERAGY
jgi:hypothetical protein